MFAKMIYRFYSLSIPTGTNVLSKGGIPELVLISGCTGTGKSTFGMEAAISRGMLKCISTDTIRQVMRTYDKSPALHRSSYMGSRDAIVDWIETCDIVRDAARNIVSDSIRRGTSLVLEGVHLIPSKDLLQLWTENGGVAVGVVLSVPDPQAHRGLLIKRGLVTGKGAEEQLRHIDRIRCIHDEIVRRGRSHEWLVVEQVIASEDIPPAAITTVASTTTTAAPTSSQSLPPPRATERSRHVAALHSVASELLKAKRALKAGEIAL